MPACCKHCGAEREFEPVEPVDMGAYRSYPISPSPESIPVEYGLRR